MHTYKRTYRSTIWISNLNEQGKELLDGEGGGKRQDKKARKEEKRGKVRGGR